MQKPVWYFCLHLLHFCVILFFWAYLKDGIPLNVILYPILNNGKISEFSLIVKSISKLCQGAPTSLVFVRVID